MNTFSRRQFLKLFGAASAVTAAGAFPRLAKAAAPARVVVVGGGFGGATVAKYLSMWGEGNVAVTLIDTNPKHVSCVLSNLVITGTLSSTRINLGFDALKTNYGINVVQGTATRIDPAGNKITITGNEDLYYDHLVLSPGIDFIPPQGTWNVNQTPHAWIAGPQTTLLKNQLAGMRARDVFVMTVPQAPYRCPPGPYERACVVADYIKRKRLTGAKVIVLDANPAITAEPIAFGNAFSNTYKGIIQYVPNATVTSVNSSTRSIVTTARTVNNARVLNYIPNQRAGKIAQRFANASGFVPVNPLTYAVSGHSNIHVIGDSCAVPASVGKSVPKSAHMANAEAKVCADAIIRSLNGELPDEDIATNSACFSPITNKTASWLSTSFIYGDIVDAAGNVIGKGMNRVDIGEADSVSSGNYEDMFTWADSLFSDCYT